MPVVPCGDRRTVPGFKEAGGNSWAPPLPIWDIKGRTQGWGCWDKHRAAWASIARGSGRDTPAPPWPSGRPPTATPGHPRPTPRVASGTSWECAGASSLLVAPEIGGKGGEWASGGCSPGLREVQELLNIQGAHSPMMVGQGTRWPISVSGAEHFQGPRSGQPIALVGLAPGCTPDSGFLTPLTHCPPHTHLLALPIWGRMSAETSDNQKAPLPSPRAQGRWHAGGGGQTAGQEALGGQPGPAAPCPPELLPAAPVTPPPGPGQSPTPLSCLFLSRPSASSARLRLEGQRVAHLWVRGEGFRHSPDCPRETQGTCEAFQPHAWDL